MKKKSKILKLKRFTVASLRTQYRIVGAGNTDEPTGCIVTVDPGLCGQTLDRMCETDPTICKTDEPSCLSSNTQPVSNARGACNSHVGGGD